MEHHQRMIIRFLYSEKTDTHDIIQRLQAQFDQNAHALRKVKFWIGEVCRGRQDLYDENCMGRPLLDNFDTKILTILDKYLFKSARSIVKILYVSLAKVLRHLHDFIYFKSFHLY
jgi:hypothetical protein